MATAIGNICRAATRLPGSKLNILTFPTHERYETGLAKTGHNFYAWRGQGVKEWNESYAQRPHNYFLLNKDSGWEQIPLDLDLDLVLSQNKFGQFPVAYKISRELHLPLVSLEHTLPIPDWLNRLEQFKNMRGDVNVFISEYSREQWGWQPNEAEVIHHGIDTDIFSPVSKPKEIYILSVVNDFANRDWCCFVSGTRIPTYNGIFSNIEDIDLEDKLYASNNRTIYELIRREYSGELIEIYFGYNNKHTVTPEHPYYTNRGIVLAKDICVQDSIMYQFPECPKEIDLTITLDGKYSIVDEYIKCVGNTTDNAVLQHLTVNQDFLEFIGWYLAEGCVTNRNIEFDLSSEEVDIANQLIEYGKTIHVNGFIKKNSIGDSIRVVFTSKPLAQFIGKTFGYNSSDKHIPANFMSPYCIPLFLSLLAGDGTINNRRIKFDSKSRNLVESFFMFFSQFGIVGRLSQRTREGFGINSDLYTITYYGERCDNILLMQYTRPVQFGIQVKDVKRVNCINVEVYNFRVSNDNLYTTLYGTTHNCGFQLWQDVTRGLPTKLLGDNPGMSKPAASIEELVSEYRRARVFLNTSLISPVPTVLLEAMACGCPVVSTDTCMIPEIIKNGHNGFICKTGQEMRQRVEELLEDEELGIQLGQAARETILNQFPINKFVSNWNRLLTKVADMVYIGDTDEIESVVG